jgi:Protein of unknown function (DUF1566)
MKQQRRRSGILIGLVALGLLAMAALTARPAQAVDAADPYYAEPAWDQKIAAAGRFVVLTNWTSQAVLDKETGLVWERSPAATIHTWFLARYECANRTTGNRKGWRLPSLHELASLVLPSVPPPGPTLPPGHPFLTVQSATYWSATSTAVNSANAWFVPFDSGDVSNDDKANGFHAWCVRGGMYAEQY